MRKVLIFLLLVPIISFGQNINLKKGLVAHYPFNGSAKDISGSNYHGVVKGAKLTNDRNGNNNSAYSFDGKSGHIKVPHKSGLNLGVQFTVSAWVYNKNANKYAFIRKGRDVGDGSFALSPKSFNICYKYRDYASTNQSYLKPIKDNKWVFLVAVVTKNEMRYYKDGRLYQKKKIKPFNQKNNYPLLFGRHYMSASSNGSGSYTFPWEGKLDDVRIYNRALNESEIKALYKGGSDDNKSGTLKEVVYKDKQIKNEPSFTLYDVNIDFSHYTYSEKTKSLFLLTSNGIKQYNFSDISNKKTKVIDIPLNFEPDINKNGISVNSDGTFLALIDNNKIIHIIDILTKKEFKQIKIKKKFYNFSGKSKTLKSNPFNFISKNELLFAGNKYAGIYNINTGKVKKVSLKRKKLDIVPATSVNSYTKSIVKEQRVYKSKRYGYTFFVNNENKAVYNWGKFIIEDLNFVYDIKKQQHIITRKKNNENIPYLFVGSNGVYDINKKAYVNGNKITLYNRKDKTMRLPVEIKKTEWINNYRQLLGFKSDNKGIVVYDYNRVITEVAKQYFLKAQDENTYASYTNFLKEYPYSSYKDLCNQNLDDFYKNELTNLKSKYSKYSSKTYISKLNEYIKKYPKSAYIVDAKNEKNKKYTNEYDKIKNSTDHEKFEKYISDYPRSPHKQVARNKLGNIYKTKYDEVCEINTYDAYLSYTTKYPQSNYVSQANKKLDKFVQQKKDEKELYKKVKNNNSYYDCEQYIAQFPNGEYIEEVKSIKKGYDDRRNAIEKGKNTKSWRLGNNLCLVNYSDVVLLCGVLDSWNGDKSMAKIKLNSGMWDKAGTTYKGNELVKNSYIWITPSDGWHICADFEIDLLNENSNMPGTSTSTNNISSSNTSGKRCYWHETLTFSNNDGSIMGSLFSSLTDIKIRIKYEGVIEQEIGDNYKIIISNAYADLGSRASYNQIKYKKYANEKVSKSIGQNRVKRKSAVKVY